MFAVRLAAKTIRRAGCVQAQKLPARSSTFRPLQQNRFASYQRFPGRGGGSGGSKYSNFGPIRRVQYIWGNYRVVILAGGAGAGTIYVTNLEEVPVTHRRRFNVISPETEKSMLGDSGYQEILQQYRSKILPPEHQYSRLVAKVVERLLPSTGGLAGDDWVIHVIDEPDEKNAFVMPGGKVFVFTGILPICKDENGLAAVLGHEIAHNVAHHVAERLSRSAFILPAVLGVSLVFDVSGQIANTVVNLALSLPNSRTQEAEADHIGVLMMAESCYDPHAALDFWGRMREAQKGAPPQFLSTHPSDYNRIENIRKWLPEAEDKYRAGECGPTSSYASEFKKTFGGQQQPSPQIYPPQQPQTSGVGDDDFF